MSGKSGGDPRKVMVDLGGDELHRLVREEYPEGKEPPVTPELIVSLLETRFQPPFWSIIEELVRDCDAVLEQHGFPRAEFVAYGTDGKWRYQERDIEPLSDCWYAAEIGNLCWHVSQDRAATHELQLRRIMEIGALEKEWGWRAKYKGHTVRGIDVKRAYAPDLPRIQAYGGELNQVWTNLIDNAADALEGHGDITIRTSASEDMVIVDIEDNGPGIPKEYQQKIFDPFFTTKPPGEGTGLGLNISYGIVVQKHHGDIRLDSKPGKTQFKVSIPLNFETSVPQKPVAGWAFSGRE